MPAKVRTRADCPPIPVTPAFYDNKTNQFYRVGPKGQIQKSKSRNGKWSRADLKKVTRDLAAQLEQYSTICQSGDISSLQNDQGDGRGSLITQSQSDPTRWYAIGPKGGILVLKEGKTKWSSVDFKKVPLDIKIWQVNIKDAIDKEVAAAKQKKRAQKLDIWLAQNKHVLPLDDTYLRPTQPPQNANDDETWANIWSALADNKDSSIERYKDEIKLENYYWDSAARQILVQKKKSWELTPFVFKTGKSERLVDRFLKQVRGSFYAEEALAIWLAQYGSYDGAFILELHPWVMVKRGPFCETVMLNDFSDIKKGFVKQNIDPANLPDSIGGFKMEGTDPQALNAIATEDCVNKPVRANQQQAAQQGGQGGQGVPVKNPQRNAPDLPNPDNAKWQFE